MNAIGFLQIKKLKNNLERKNVMEDLKELTRKELIEKITDFKGEILTRVQLATDTSLWLTVDKTDLILNIASSRTERKWNAYIQNETLFLG
jgi:hypothetical protein